VFDNALNARNFGGRQAFPESAPYSLARRGITKDSVAIWHDGFDDVNNWSCFHGNGWLDLYDVVGNRWQRALPTHVNQGPWLRSYNGITVANSPGLCGRLVRTATKHALIGEFRSRFFPGKPPEDLHGSLHAPETRDHILNSCSWYVRRANHYIGGIDTIPGLILFLCDNPTAFSFDPTDCLRRSHPDWPSYYREVYRQRDATNKIRKQKKLPLEIGPIFYHETVEFFFESVLDFLLKAKSEAFEAFKVYKSWAENQLGVKLRALQYDFFFFFFFFFSMAAYIRWTFTWLCSTPKHLVT
jgi:hypothetical protein